ncbi:hypothetical protein [Chloroflexus sp. Y-396-1]|uniref:hypothetical protein n=1 Tax=Chloroflexus sp. Y-396-1 TaxID=867845 RepID=UPI00048D581E|nr:hypothetical protein [Chloroflexus sp. Y-396-1]
MRQWVWTRHRGQLLPWAAVLIAAVLVPFSFFSIEWLYRQRYTEVVREAMKATAQIIATTPDYADLSRGTAVRLNPAVLRTIDDLIVVNLGDAVSEPARRHLANSLVVMMRPIRWKPRQYDDMDPRQRELFPIITMYGNGSNAALRSAVEEELMFWTNELTPTAQWKGGVGTTVCIGGIVTFEGPLAHLFGKEQPVVGCATVVSF